MFTTGKHRAGALVSTTLLLAAPALAEDESVGVAPGLFRAVPAGSVAPVTARAVLDGETVQVTLAVVARARATVLLPLPRFGWLGAAETYPDRHFPELAMAIDGRAVTPSEQVVATAQGRDVTALVRAAGVDPLAIAETPPLVEAASGRQAAFEALLAAGAATRQPDGFFAAWTARRTVGIALHHGAHRVGVRYKARPAYALSTLAAAPVRWADYCTTPAAAARLLARRGLRGPVLARAYAIPVAMEGAAPRAVTLRAFGDPGVTMACGTGGAPLIDPAGDVPVRPGADGTVRVLRLGEPG